MRFEEAETFWVVKGVRIDGKEIERTDYVRHDIKPHQVRNYAEQLMRKCGIVKAKVYVFKKVEEMEIDLEAEEIPCVLMYSTTEVV